MRPRIRTDIAVQHRLLAHREIPVAPPQTGVSLRLRRRQQIVAPMREDHRLHVLRVSAQRLHQQPRRLLIPQLP